MSASWAIVTTAREPAALMLAHTGWHLGTGAYEVFVYLDDPEDPVAGQLATLPRVHVTLCDDAHWHRVAARQVRPDSINRRQSLNANDALARTQADWLIHIDADEFLLQERPLGAELAVIDGLDCELHLTVAERFFPAGYIQTGLFDGHFRTTTRWVNRRTDGTTYDAAIFGDHAPCLVNGVLGHAAGKCGVPRGGPFRIGIHWAYRGETRHRAERYHSSSTRLLHFDGLTRLHWLSKLLRYAEVDPEVMGVADHRRAQIELFRTLGADLSGGLTLHAELRELGPDLTDRLRAFGLLWEQSFDPVPVLRHVLPTMPDLSAAAFDAALMHGLPRRWRKALAQG